MFRLTYRREVLEELSRELPPEVRDEMAIPSYLHPNPLIRKLVEHRMGVILRLANLQDHHSLLDYGCGTGMLLLQLPRQQRSWGVDVFLDPAQKVLAAHDRADVELIEVSSWAEEIPDATVDRIVALEVLEHVADVASLARSFHRKLKPDGKLVVCGPTENRLYQLGRTIAGFSGEYHRRDIYEIMRDVESCGFEAESRRSIPLPWPSTLFVATRYRRSS